MKKVIIVGSLNTDLVINAPYAPQGGETLMGSGFMINPGGKGANQACATAKLGGMAYMCGCVGNDSFGNELIDNLKNAGVNTDFIRRVENTPTGVAVIVVTQGENRIIIDSGANGFLSEGDIDRVLEIAEAGDIYLTQLENPIDVIGYGLKRAKEKGLFTVLNPAPANKDILKYIEYVDIITPNETESEILGGKEALLNAGIETVITTLGSRGFEIATQGGKKTYPCIKITPVDTTAAGDTACGGLCAKLSMGESLESAMKYGSLAASIACTRQGAQMSIPTKEEVENYK
ncbi:MAG: ribokinase [Ruminococcaceae bacterium]|nr:ribokinase [Oscillospiraceae bacterium]